MDIIVKKDVHKIDFRHPQSTDSNYQKRVDKGLERLRTGKAKFENEAQKRDYMKKVDSNPANTVGNPVFFPPLTIRSAMNGTGLKHDCSKSGHRWSNTKDAFCWECDVKRNETN